MKRERPSESRACYCWNGPRPGPGAGLCRSRSQERHVPLRAGAKAARPGRKLQTPEQPTLPAPSRDPASSLPAETAEEDQGPEEGLTLDAAIEQLLSRSLDLAAKRQDIPKARADILTAGLRNNPVVFLSASQLPYQQYSSQRPGTPLYDVTIVQPVDVSGKHRASVQVADHQLRVLEARYQDAVRHEIDRLYTAYIDVLEAQALQRGRKPRSPSCPSWRRRPASWCSRSSGRRPRSPPLLCARPARKSPCSARRWACVGRGEPLAVLLATPEEASTLQLRGSLQDRAPPPPCLDELLRIAREGRPDLASYRLSVQRAQAQVHQARTEAIEDVFLFFSPYQATSFSAEGKQTATGFELGILLPIPAFNRNQGNVAHTRANVVQTRIEVESVEQQVVSEVQRAAAEYEVSREEVERFERDLLPGVRSVRDDQVRLYVNGQQGIDPS